MGIDPFIGQERTAFRGVRGLLGGGEHARGAVEAMREDACHDTHQELVRVGDDFVRCDTSHARLLVPMCAVANGRFTRLFRCFF